LECRLLIASTPPTSSQRLWVTKSLFARQEWSVPDVWPRYPLVNGLATTIFYESTTLNTSSLLEYIMV